MKIVKPTLSNSRIETDSDKTFFDVDEKFIMSLAHLVGFNESLQYTDLLKIDGDGNLLVSSGGSASEDFIISTATIGTTASLLIASRVDRKKLYIRNDGSERIYFSSADNVATNTGFILDSGSVFIEENFIGSLYGIAPTTDNSIVVGEFV